MTEERIERLQSIGFEWSIRTPETTWKNRVEELRQFKMQYGADCPVVAKCTRLGVFAQNQRIQRMYFDDGRPSTLDEHKIAELDSLEFCWVVEESTGTTDDSNGVNDEILERVIHSSSNESGLQNPNPDIMDEHVIHPHNDMYHHHQDQESRHGHHHTMTMEASDQMNLSYEQTEHHRGEVHVHTNNHIEGATVHLEQTSHNEYDRTMPMLSIPGVDPYNLAGGAVSMAADIAAAVTVNNAIHAEQETPQTPTEEQSERQIQEGTEDESYRTQWV
mmetsp:Transcript_13658/g.19979  ORF Transcript_13658/g.19979 Transcript_13658/m.19979 type:complete len:275 (+) Transcript_13658:3-827(+)